MAVFKWWFMPRKARLAATETQAGAMSDTSQGAGWWLASDGKWYRPEQHDTQRPPPPPATGHSVLSGTPASKPKRRCSHAGVVIGFNVVMLIWIIWAIATAAHQSANCQYLMHQDCINARDAEAGIAVFVIIFLAAAVQFDPGGHLSGDRRR